MKIYTKTGDSGHTSLLGGSRVAKHDLRIEAYGTVDELNSWMGWVRDASGSILGDDLLQAIQENLFVIGSNLAAEKDQNTFVLPKLPLHALAQLENAIDQMQHSLPALNSFILPGGNAQVSQLHVARTVCRRAERRLAALIHEEDYGTEELIYLNRLSDYLFVAARFTGMQTNAKEHPWRP